MPISRTSTAQGGTDYGSPFVGPMGAPLGINVTISSLTTAEVDSNGVLKPGVPLQRNGTLVGIAPAYPFGCVIEATKVAKSNASADMTAAGTKEIAVYVAGAVQRDILEDILGRALTADEVAGFARAGSLIRLLD